MGFTVGCQGCRAVNRGLPAVNHNEECRVRIEEQMRTGGEEILKKAEKRVRGEDDKTNMHSRFREGWEPVRADEYPDSGGMFPTIDEGKNTGVIGVGGLMLARIPEETVEERTEYYRDQTRNQMKAVDENLMREQHPSMPIHNGRQSRVTFGGKPKPSE